MNEPTASRPHWPDLADMPKEPSQGLKPWSWALERLEKSHNYWIATTRPGGRPHLMVVWGVWWEEAFWFSTGPNTRKAKNIASDPHVVIATEKAGAEMLLEPDRELHAANPGHELSPSDVDCHLTRAHWDQAHCDVGTVSRPNRQVCDRLHAAPSDRGHIS